MTPSVRWSRHRSRAPWGADAPVLEQRVRQVLDALGHPAPAGPDGATGATSAHSARSALDALGAALVAEGIQSADAVWLTLAVVQASLPTADRVRALTRRLSSEGPDDVVHEVIATTSSTHRSRPVAVLTGRVLVDIHQLLHTPFTTGIQRVEQEAVARWSRDHDVVPVAWTDGFQAVRPVGTDELAAVLPTVVPGATPAAPATAGAPATPGVPATPGAPATAGPPRAATTGDDVVTLVPWRCTYLLPELVLDPPRTARLQALAMHSRSRTGAIVHDLVPITFATTTDQGVPGQFALQLAAIQHFDRLVADSEATRTEYEGWGTMRSAIGIPGPSVVAVPLPGAAGPSDPAVEDEMRRRYAPPEEPLVLCVGSHEPRKNHTAVLHAAELAWRTGTRFRLVLVGGNAWSNGPFTRALTELHAAGRPVETVSGITDDGLWALYRLARVTVFPSLSEGFGLPAAESLAVGTPVITSGFGSMAEIARDGGALLVDPRDDHALAQALVRVLTDDALHARLCAEAAARPARSWDDYAREAWDVLVADDR